MLLLDSELVVMSELWQADVYVIVALVAFLCNASMADG